MLPTRWESGGAGMVGTIGDYARFVQMLLNGGILDGRRYLKPETIALDDVGSYRAGNRNCARLFLFSGRRQRFRPRLCRAHRAAGKYFVALGEYRWDGVGGTFFFVDPKDDMFTVCMIQTPSQRGRIQAELKALIYEALGE